MTQKSTLNGSQTSGVDVGADKAAVDVGDGGLLNVGVSWGVIVEGVWGVPLWGVSRRPQETSKKRIRMYFEIRFILLYHASVERLYGGKTTVQHRSGTVKRISHGAVDSPDMRGATALVIARRVPLLFSGSLFPTVQLSLRAPSTHLASSHPPIYHPVS